MTDTTHSEADMGYVRDFVATIAKALVAATELPKQIEAMQADLNTLHGDLDRTKARNIELDTLLNDTRRQRDEAEQALSTVKAQLADTSARNETQAGNLASYQRDLDHLRDELAKVKAERDDYGLRQMEAEDRAKAAEAKLDKLREAMGIPKPAEPQAEAVVVQSERSTTGTTSQLMTEPPKAHEPERIYEGEPGFNERSYANEKFDQIQGRYYRTRDEISF